MMHKLTEREILISELMRTAIHAPDRNKVFHFADWGSRDSVKQGDIILISSVRPSIWDVSEVMEIEPVLSSEGKETDRKYLLRAVGTDELCWWSNISICRITLPDDDFRMRRFRMRPFQRNFEKKWLATSCPEMEPHCLVKAQVDFEDSKATCNWRSYLGIVPEERLPPTVVFEDIREVSQNDMDAALRQAITLFNSEDT